MPRALSHAVVLTDDLDETLRFLTEVANLSPARHIAGASEDYSTIFGWPIEQAATRGAFVGEGAGMLEVVEIPVALRDTVTPGVRFLAVANRDVVSAADAAATAGFAVRGPLSATSAGENGATVAEVTAGGIAFELIQFG